MQSSSDSIVWTWSSGTIRRCTWSAMRHLVPEAPAAVNHALTTAIGPSFGDDRVRQTVEQGAEARSVVAGRDVGELRQGVRVRRVGWIDQCLDAVPRHARIWHASSLVHPQL